MKKRILCFAVSVLCAVSLVLPSAGCTAQQASLSPTKTLSIYLPPRDGGLEYYSDPLRIALGTFRKKYPDVKIEIRDFNDPQDPEGAYNAYLDTLKTELAAGKGPDLVYFMAHDFDDLEKTMDSGVFFDLNQAISKDDSFHMDGYISSIMNVCQRENSLPLLPVDYSSTVLITSQETLDEAGLKPTSNLDSFLTELEQYYKKTKTRQTVDSDYSPSWLFYYLIDYSGMTILDYQKKHVALETAQFRHLAETYKVIYDREQDVPEADRTAGGQFADFFLKGGSLFTVTYRGDGVISRCAEIAMAGQTPIIIPVPSEKDSALRGMLEPFVLAGIPKGSPNKQNAYNLIKVMLEKDRDPVTDTYPLSTMRLDLLPKMLTQSSTRDINELRGLGKDLGASPDKVEKVRVDTVKQAQALLTNAPATLGLAQPAKSILWTEMEPYFKGERSLDEAIASAQDKLELYIAE